MHAHVLYEVNRRIIDRNLIIMIRLHTCFKWACVYTLITCLIMFDVFIQHATLEKVWFVQSWSPLISKNKCIEYKFSIKKSSSEQNMNPITLEFVPTIMFIYYFRIQISKQNLNLLRHYHNKSCVCLKFVDTCIYS